MKNVLLLAAGLSAAALAASASPPPATLEPGRHLTVATREVDFSDPAQVQALHRRLRRAAAAVCDSREKLTLEVVAGKRACIGEALDRAVEQAGEPRLTAYHQAASRPARQTRMAAGGPGAVQ